MKELNEAEMSPPAISMAVSGLSTSKAGTFADALSPANVPTTYAPRSPNVTGMLPICDHEPVPVLKSVSSMRSG